MTPASRATAAVSRHSITATEGVPLGQAARVPPQDPLELVAPEPPAELPAGALLGNRDGHNNDQWLHWSASCHPEDRSDGQDRSPQQGGRVGRDPTGPPSPQDDAPREEHGHDHEDKDDAVHAHLPAPTLEPDRTDDYQSQEAVPREGGANRYVHTHIVRVHRIGLGSARCCLVSPEEVAHVWGLSPAGSGWHYPIVDERWQLPTKVLPSGGTQAWYVADGVLTSRRVDGAQVLPGAFLLPGLVDAHTHLAVRNYVPVGLPEALDALVGARNAGVLLLRDLGAPKGVRLAFPDDIPLPRVLAAGPWLATDEFFPDDRHDPVPPERLTEAAKGIVREGLEWVKVVADWMEPRLTYRFDVLRAAVDAVHEGGARVAAHSTRVTHEVVRAGVDSVEHGDEMDDETLAVMADRGIAWTPTVSALERDRAWAQAVIDSFDAATDPPERLAYAERWKGVWDRAAERLGERLPAAASLGVTILAGPDNGGSVATEVLLLHKYGLGVDQALAAATTGARRFLGAPALQEGAPADVVTFDSDPSGDLTVLSRPVAVLVGGHRV